MVTRPNTFTEVENVSDGLEIPRLCVSDVLRGMKQAVRLFTPGLLITHGGFDRDPVREFDVRFPAANSDERPFAVDLKRDSERFFTGFGAYPSPNTGRLVNWDQRLYGIVESRSDECFSFLAGIAFSNPANNYYASTLSYDLRIKDPTAKIITPLLVKIFGVLANTFVVYVEDTFVAPRVIKQYGKTGFNLTQHVPKENLLANPFDDDPLLMRDQ